MTWYEGYSILNWLSEGFFNIDNDDKHTFFEEFLIDKYKEDIHIILNNLFDLCIEYSVVTKNKSYNYDVAILYSMKDKEGYIKKTEEDILEKKKEIRKITAILTNPAKLEQKYQEDKIYINNIEKKEYINNLEKKRDYLIKVVKVNEEELDYFIKNYDNIIRRYTNIFSTTPLNSAAEHEIKKLENEIVDIYNRLIIEIKNILTNPEIFKQEYQNKTKYIEDLTEEEYKNTLKNMIEINTRWIERNKININELQEQIDEKINKQEYYLTNYERRVKLYNDILEKIIKPKIKSINNYESLQEITCYYEYFKTYLLPKVESTIKVVDFNIKDQNPTELDLGRGIIVGFQDEESMDITDMVFPSVCELNKMLAKKAKEYTPVKTYSKK